MAVVVKKLLIRAQVSSDQASSNTFNGNGQNGKMQIPAIEREVLIEECVEKVMDIIEKQKQR